MARIKYYYDTETCKYERIRVSTGDVVLNLLGFLSVALILATGIVWAYTSYFESPKEALLKKENEELKLSYEVLDKEMENVTAMLENLQDRDDNVYRTIYEAEPIPSSVRESGIGGAERYRELLDQGLEQEDLILSSFEKIDQIKKKMYIQTKSYDEILQLALDRDKLLAAIPAIVPVSNKDVKRVASGFGIRWHPIYKVRKMHYGNDFSAPRGTPIYATGDGVIEKAKKSNSALGFGNYIQINHGYGYQTIYAHMHSFAADLKVGDKVKRGQVIGYVGNTGGSTAPHCHYEVLKDGKHKNPIQYYFQDITDEEFEELVKQAAVENESLG